MVGVGFGRISTLGYPLELSGFCSPNNSFFFFPLILRNCGLAVPRLSLLLSRVSGAVLRAGRPNNNPLGRCLRDELSRPRPESLTTTTRDVWPRRRSDAVCRNASPRRGVAVRAGTRCSRFVSDWTLRFLSCARDAQCRGYNAGDLSPPLGCALDCELYRPPTPWRSESNQPPARR